MLAKTLFGLEDILADELRQLGAQDVISGNRSVRFKGDKGFMYKANLGLRTAIKILKPIKNCRVLDEQQLYDSVQNIPWEKYLDKSGTLAVDATVNSKRFTHSKYVALKTKDAIVDRFREKFGERPGVDLRFPDLKINVHIDRERCTISLDSSGESLHRRGYKIAVGEAPINEVLAAGILLRSGWNGQCDFLDPMCGSGTILIEAAMIACKIPPNLHRKEFGFERWKDWDEALFEKVEASLLKRSVDLQVRIMGYDQSRSMIITARKNIKNANLDDFIEIQQQDFFKSEKPVEGPLHLVFNPPYGERLEVDVDKFYGDLGSTLKHAYPDSTAWFISSNLEGLKHVGLRPSKKIKMYNGKLEARLLKYELYKGSRKAKKQN